MNVVMVCPIHHVTAFKLVEVLLDEDVSVRAGMEAACI